MPAPPHAQFRHALSESGQGQKPDLDIVPNCWFFSTITALSL
jgi:hypothetical protein